MPELPEVESTCRALRAGGLIGQKIIDLHIRPLDRTKLADLEQQRTHLLGATVQEVGRRGKYILLTLSGVELVIHLRMSGRLWVVPREREKSGYERATLPLTNELELRLHDPRRFATVQLHIDTTQQTARQARDEFLAQKCGMEPLSDQFTTEWCATALRKRRGALKPLLLKQTVIAGLGNIYCDEALWWGRLHPARQCDTLTLAETTRLHRAIRGALQRGIRHGGTTLGSGVSNFRLPQHQTGNREGLRAYGRTTHPCPRCSTKITRITSGGRSTHFCPQCQRL